MNQHYSSISSAESRITTIDAQLEPLQTAKKSVGEIQKKVHDTKKDYKDKVTLVDVW